MKKFNTRILIFLILIVILSLSFNPSKIYAYSTNDTAEFDNKVISKVKSLKEYSEYQYYITFLWGFNSNTMAPNIHIIFFNDTENLKFYLGEYNYNTSLFASKSFYRVEYILNRDTLEIENKVEMESDYIIHIWNNNGKYEIFSNYDIYNSSSCTDFFLKAPPKTIAVVLTQEIKRSKIAGTLKTMIIGFLKYLIVFVTSVIAFWKGWRFLFRNFKKA